MTTAAEVLTLVAGMLPNTFAQPALLAALNTALGDAGKAESTLDITALADTARYAITIPPEQIFRVDVIAAGESAPKEFYWWRAFGGYLYIDNHAPSAGDTLRVSYYDKPATAGLSTVIPSNIDAHRLMWLTVYYACIARMQIQANTDSTIEKLFAQADKMRNEFMVRRRNVQRGPSPHYSNW